MSDWTGSGTPVTPVPVTTPSTPFRDMLAADLDAVFFNVNEFAELITYTPNGGAAKYINIVPAAEDLAGQTPAPPGDTMVIMAKYSDIASPGRGDTFILNTVTWYFVELVGGGRMEGVWHIRISRSARRSVNERSY